MRAFVVVMVIGCRGAPPPPPPIIVTDLPEPEPPPPCITPPDVATHITHAYGDATRVMYCIGDTSDQCFSLELGSGKLARLTEAPIAPTHSARIETKNPELKVCTGDMCTPLTDKIMPGAAALHATTNDAGTIAVVLLGDAPAGKGYAEVWDVVAGKRLSAFFYARGEYRCGEVSMVGDAIFVAASTCGAPAARGALYSQRGYKIANVGGRDFGAYGGAFAQVDPTTWAFLEENANRIAIQDVVRGRVKKTIDTSALWSADGGSGARPDAMGNPGESALITLGDGKLAVIAGAPADGSVAIVDIATGKIDVTRAPMCAPAPATASGR